MLSNRKMNINIYNVVGIEHLQSRRKTSDGSASNNFKILLIPAQTEPEKGNK